MLSNRLNRRTLVGVASLGCLSLAPIAAGQDALGDGHALDANLRTGSGGRNTQVRDVMQTIRFNNAIVEGTVVGGSAFRGVGGLAPDDFRGALGANDLYRFRRDTALQGTVGQVGVRGTDALRYQFSLTTGQTVPTAFALSDPAIARSGSGASGRSLSNSLRSTAEFQAAQAARPSLIGFKQTADGVQYAVTASPLLGVKPMRMSPPPPPDEDDFGMERKEETAPPASAMLTGIERSALGVQDTLSATRRIDTLSSPQTVDTRSRTYDEIMSEFQGRMEEALPGDDPEAVEGELPWWEVRLEEFRERLEAQERDAQPETDEGTDPAAEDGQDFVFDQILLQHLGIDPALVVALGGAPESVRTFIDSGAEPQTDIERRYVGFMNGGELAIREERYFDAEDRFLRAMGARPGDPMAQVGRLNAELGAGLYVSAAENLKAVIRRHPEITGVRYERTLMPKPQRLGVIIEQLRTAGDREMDGLGRDAGLLLAYVGYQVDKPELVTRGLEVFADDADEDSISERSMMALLRSIWLSDTAQQP